MDSNSDRQVEVDDQRAAARQRLEDRRGLATHAVVYLVVNAFLVVAWAVNGAGYFWPVWSIGGWGIGLVVHAWSVFGDRPVTEADVDAELERNEASAAGSVDDGSV